jgi:transposase
LGEQESIKAPRIGGLGAKRTETLLYQLLEYLVLEEERDGLRAQGIARAGCWIETGEVQGRQFRQAWWRSHQAMFPAKRDLGQGRGLVKSLYIGEEGSEAHRTAIAQRDRRNRVRQIDRQLQKLKGCGE